MAIRSPREGNVRYLVNPVVRNFKKYDADVIHVHEFVRHMKSAWSETPCSNDVKYSMIVDNVTDRIRQLLRLYAPSDDLREMLAAVIKLDIGESVQEIVENFYNMRQDVHGLTDTVVNAIHDV